MGKKSRPATPPPRNRRQRIASLAAAQKRANRRTMLLVLAISLAASGAILAYPIYLAIDSARWRDTALNDIGAPAAAAGCQPPQQQPATGNQDHVSGATPISYDRQPPDSGPHIATPAPMTPRFYTTDNRPPAAALVHNLEHGYTIAWYRPDAPEPDLTALEHAAATLDGATSGGKFIAAPWNDSDGNPLPPGVNLVLSHWYADPDNPTNQSAQRGIQQSCTAVSGEVIQAFTHTYPATSAPEPNGV